MCFGGLAPWLAPILAWLGLPVPLLPSGTLRYILAALACYRMVQAVGLDDGVFGAMLWIRERAGAYDRGSNGQPRRALGRMLACPYCLGSVFGFLNACLALWPSLEGDLLLVVFGIAGAQALLREIIHGPREGWG